jgi:hypothetical protein
MTQFIIIFRRTAVQSIIIHPLIEFLAFLLIMLPKCPRYDGELEVLTPEQQKEKELLIKELTKRLSGPLADENGNVPTGLDRPIAIEVDGPSHFYANSQRYTA